MRRSGQRTLGEAPDKVLPRERENGPEDGVPHDLGRAAGLRKVLEGHAVAFEAGGAGLALKLGVRGQAVSDRMPGCESGCQASRVCLRPCQGYCRSACQMGCAVISQTQAGPVRPVLRDHEGLWRA